MTIIALLTAFGLGSVITVLTQALITNYTKKFDRSFEERKAAYIGLLEAYHRAAVEGTDTAAKNFAYWQIRCELVAPRQVRDAIARIVETNDDRLGRVQAHEALKDALRIDLKIGLR